mgnify:CR=1 FL=1
MLAFKKFTGLSVVTMLSSSTKVLLTFIKNPQKGKVKTRLAQSLGDQKALDIYRQLVQKTREVTDAVQCDRQVWYSSFIEDNDGWSSGGYDKRLQHGDDLGERMAEAFRQAFDEGYSKPVIIGSDCPGLTPKIIEKAFDGLVTHDVVLGPSRDGGYYLLGMSSFYGDLFIDIPWSTPFVFDQTVAKIKSLDLSFNTLPVLNDIDTEQDLIESDFIPERS